MMQEILPWVSLVVSLLSGPIVLGALNAILSNRAQAIYDSRIAHDKASMLDEAKNRARDVFDEMMRRERDQMSKEYATREDVAELRSDVKTLIGAFEKMDNKLDRFLGVRIG
jgi:polyhydroxyalkanoate synthesis regulator phasin